jgi:hypothetical protein
VAEVLVATQSSFLFKTTPNAKVNFPRKRVKMVMRFLKVLSGFIAVRGRGLRPALPDLTSFVVFGPSPRF